MDLLVASERETGVPILTVFQHRFGQAALDSARSPTPVSWVVPRSPPARPCGTAMTPTSLSRGEVAGTWKVVDPRWATASTSSISCSLFSVRGHASAHSQRDSPARPIPKTCRSRSPNSRTARLPRSSTPWFPRERRRACGSTTNSPRRRSSTCGDTQMRIGPSPRLPDTSILPSCGTRQAGKSAVTGCR